jgi:hypothetical protein
MVEHQASCAAIFGLCKSMPQFERDVCEAQSVFGKRLEAQDANEDEDVFPACEFHSHMPSGNCHTSDGGRTLYLGKLPYAITKEDLTAFFTVNGYPM